MDRVWQKRLSTGESGGGGGGGGGGGAGAAAAAAGTLRQGGTIGLRETGRDGHAPDISSKPLRSCSQSSSACFCASIGSHFSIIALYICEGVAGLSHVVAALSTRPQSEAVVRGTRREAHLLIEDDALVATDGAIAVRVRDGPPSLERLHNDWVPTERTPTTLGLLRLHLRVSLRPEGRRLVLLLERHRSLADAPSWTPNRLTPATMDGPFQLADCCRGRADTRQNVCPAAYFGGSSVHGTGERRLDAGGEELGRGAAAAGAAAASTSGSIHIGTQPAQRSPLAWQRA